MTLVELKAKAAELGLTPDEVRQHGSLAKKATWETAIAEFNQWEEAVNTHCEEMDIPQWTYPEDESTIEPHDAEPTAEDIVVQRNTEAIEPPNEPALCDGSVTEEKVDKDNAVQRNTDDELPFEPTQTLIDGKWVKIDGEWVKAENSNPPPSGIRPFRPVLTEICKPDNSGYLVWSDKFKRWVKEKPSESSTPIRDKLFAKMMGYVGTALSLSDLEEMQKESPGEKTAAIYLAILEESERLLIEAVAA